MKTFNPSKVMSAHRKLRSNEQGFTIIEVLVAVFIVALALIGAMRGLSGLAEAANSVEQRMAALWVADDILLKQKIEQTNLQTGETTNNCEFGRLSFDCVVKINPTPNPFFFRVVVEVYTKEPKDAPIRLAQIFHVVPKYAVR